MTEKPDRLAGKTSEIASRRTFFGRFAQVASGVALTVAGLVAAGPVAAAKPAKKLMCCEYGQFTEWGGILFMFRCVEGKCPQKHGPWVLWDSWEVSDCSECGGG